MKEFLKHPLALMIVGSIITYFLIPELQESNIEKKALLEYETKLVSTNNEMASELNDMLDLFEDFAWEVGNDTTISKEEVLAIQDKYRSYSQEVIGNMYQKWYEIKSLKSELFLHYSFSDEEQKHLNKHFSILFGSINKSILENKKLMRQCFYERNFKYDAAIFNEIKLRRTNLGIRLRNQHRQLELVCAVLNY